MKIVSRFPYLWPHLGFSIVEGVNDIEESKIPLAAHAKLVHLSKPGVPTVVMDEDGKRIVAPTPAPISGYEPSKRLIDAAEKHFPRHSAVKLGVATLDNIPQAQPAPEAQKAEPSEPRREQSPQQKR